MSEHAPFHEVEVESQRNEALLYLCHAGWANRSSGSLDAFNGKFWAVSNQENEVAQILDVLDGSELPLDSPARLVGHFMVFEKPHLLAVLEFASQEDAWVVFEASERAQSRWDEL